MNPWHHGYLLALDTETSDPSPDWARVVTAAAFLLGPGVRREYSWMVNPGVTIPQAAIDVHHVTNERAVAEGRPPGEVLAEVVALIGKAARTGTPVVGHNVVYDLTVIDRECRRHNVVMPALGPVIDTLVLDKHVWPYRRGSRRLGDVLALYGIDLVDAHEATADAYGAARLAHRIASIAAMSAAHRPAFTRAGSHQQAWEDVLVDPGALHDAQVGWKEAQAASLETYFRRTEPGAVVNPEWPVQSLPPGWSPEAVPAEQVAS